MRFEFRWDLPGPFDRHPGHRVFTQTVSNPSQFQRVKIKILSRNIRTRWPIKEAVAAVKVMNLL